MPKTPVVPISNLRIRVRSRTGKQVQAAILSLDSPALTTKTDAMGFATFGLTEAQIAALSPANQITLHAKKRHHGPDPGVGKVVVPGEIKLTATVSKAGFDPKTLGLDRDKKGAFLDLVLMDAGFNFGVATPGVATRRLTSDQVQKELMFLQSNGDVVLTTVSEFQFNHDTTSGEFDACDPAKCKLASPTIDSRVGVQKATIANVKFLYLVKYDPGKPKAATDKIPGQRFLRDKFQWNNMSLSLMDQRHVVGMARMCKELKSKHGVVAIFTLGMSGDTVRADAHGHGVAIDFGGCCKVEPDSTNKNATVRPGTDFIVFSHWGNLPMWNGVTVKANPEDPALWKRLKGGDDDGHDYSADPSGNISRLHYRLDPAPFQESVPATVTDPALAAQLGTVASHFVTTREIFQDVYDFATREYSDGNPTLGPLSAAATADIATPIDSHRGHFILHPDYPKPNAPGAKNGRQAHVDHLHFQLGPTYFPSVRTK
jgi:hypothetical protein